MRGTARAPCHLNNLSECHENIRRNEVFKYLNILSECHENIQRNKVYLHLFFNCAINIIFGKLLGLADLLPGEDPFNKSF